MVHKVEDSFEVGLFGADSITNLQVCNVNVTKIVENWGGNKIDKIGSTCFKTCGTIACFFHRFKKETEKALFING